MTEKKPVDLMDRIDAAMLDTARVGEFKIHMCDNDCIVYIRTVWGPEINTHGLRKDWQAVVTRALDELDDIKPADPSTDTKE